MPNPRTKVMKENAAKKRAQRSKVRSDLLQEGKISKGGILTGLSRPIIDAEIKKRNKAKPFSKNGPGKTTKKR